MKKLPFVSIIIPAHNAAKYIGEQLDSLHNQQYDGLFEVIVVDNLSTDNTMYEVEKFQQKMSNLSIIKATDKPSASYAMNVGIAASKGEAIISIDADDVTADGWLENMAYALSQHDLVAGGLELNRLNGFAPDRTPPFTGSERKFMGFLPYVIGCNIGFSRKAFNSVNGFDENIGSGQDVDFSWRVQLHGYSIKDVPEAAIHYRYRDSVSGMWRQTVAYANAHVKLYKKFKEFGMPQSNTRKALRVYKKLLIKLPTYFFMTESKRELYMREIAAYWGRIKGSIRYRTLYL